MIKKEINFFKNRIKRLFLYKIYSKIRRKLSKNPQEEISKKEIKFLLKKENPIVLEIGSHNGSDSKEFLDEFNKIRLYCFEPDPRSIKKFKKRINDKKCSLNEIALSNRKGYLEFYLSENVRDSEKGSDSSSLKKPKEHLEKFPWIKFEKKIKVPTDTLDNWVKKNKIKRIDFIWADVQGAEKELILGGKETLNKKTKYIYTEFYEKELYEGQIGLKEILKMLPSFRVVKIYGNNVLLKNIFIN